MKLKSEFTFFGNYIFVLLFLVLHIVLQLHEFVLIKIKDQCVLIVFILLCEAFHVEIFSVAPVCNLETSLMRRP
jgi:hypothetical protein